jgi:hypothetical protein
MLEGRSGLTLGLRVAPKVGFRPHQPSLIMLQANYALWTIIACLRPSVEPLPILKVWNVHDHLH